MSAHDAALLWLGACFGALALLMVWVLLDMRDDRRRDRRDLTPVPVRPED
jgi:hypothetical protein